MSIDSLPRPVLLVPTALLLVAASPTSPDLRGVSPAAARVQREWEDTFKEPAALNVALDQRRVEPVSVLTRPQWESRSGGGPGAAPRYRSFRWAGPSRRPG